MIPFTFECPTRFIFGENTETLVGKELKEHGATRVLFVHENTFIKTSGLYAQVVSSILEEGLTFVELTGVVPNPRVSLVRKGIDICRSEGIDFILAVGGGSTIDTCKAISFGVFYKGDVWDLVTHKALPGWERVPVGVVLTLPASGSEGSDSCVISDELLNQKAGFGTTRMRPVFSILNPVLTYTLPAYQTACGGMDIMAHVMERYFSPTENVELTDRMSEGIMKTIVNQIPIALKEPQNIAARGEIMWAGTIGQCNITGTGREQDWFNHGLEHQLSGYYDIAHGAGLGISFPGWMVYLANKPSCQKKLAQFGQRVFDVETGDTQEMALEGARRLRAFIVHIGLPVALKQVNIGSEHFIDMADRLTDGGKTTKGTFYPMSKEDIVALLTQIAQ